MKKSLYGNKSSTGQPCRMKQKDSASCAGRAQHLRPVKSSGGGGGGGKGVGGQSVLLCRRHVPPAVERTCCCRTQLTFGESLGEAALSRDRTQLLFRCQGLVHNGVWQSAQDVSSLENSLPVDLRRPGRYEGNLCVDNRLFQHPSLQKS